jgi:hypothetical protein
MKRPSAWGAIMSNAQFPRNESALRERQRVNKGLTNFFAGYQVVGEGNLIPSQWDYLGEKRISREDDLVFVPCEYFSERYWRFCFHYVSISIIGTTNTLAKMCLPAKESGRKKNKSQFALVCLSLKSLQ